MRSKRKSICFIVTIVVAALLFVPGSSGAQDLLPYDNGPYTYHESPQYRESESHPLRILGYLFHPVGWVAREAIFRPLSYFASSTETTRSVMGYRDPYDYRQPECFSADDTVPDCRATTPFNYESEDVVGEGGAPEDTASLSGGVRQVYLPDVNFDFNKHTLNTLGKGKVRQIARLLGNEPGLKIVLQGHTDSVGSDQYNEQLGMNRSETVRQELVSLGVSQDQLSSITFGENQPALVDDTDWARAVNRRVEVRVEP